MAKRSLLSRRPSYVYVLLTGVLIGYMSHYEQFKKQLYTKIVSNYFHPCSNNIFVGKAAFLCYDPDGKSVVERMIKFAIQNLVTPWKEWCPQKAFLCLKSSLLFEEARTFFFGL